MQSAAVGTLNEFIRHGALSLCDAIKVKQAIVRYAGSLVYLLTRLKL